MKYDILIYYEHEVRELESVTILKVLLENNGYSVKVIRTGSDDYILTDFIKSKFYKPPKIVITPFLYNSANVNKFSWFRFKKVNIESIINLQWEQVLSKKWIENGFHFPKGKAKLATHCAWGYFFKNELSKRGVSNKNALIIGPLHFDMLKQPFKKYYMTKNQIANLYNLDVNKKTILYISSFTFNSNSKQKIDILNKMIGSNNDFIELLAESMIKSKKETINIFDKLMSMTDNYQIVYRPHPGEEIEDVNYLQEKYSDKFLINSDYSMREWIINSDVIVTWISTGVSEAIYLNKHTIVLRPYSVNEEVDSLIFRNSKNVKNFNQLFDELENNKIYLPIETDTFREYYEIDDILSVNNICKLIKSKKIKKSKINLSYVFPVIKLTILNIYRNLYEKNKKLARLIKPINKNSALNKINKLYKSNSSRTKIDFIDGWTTRITNYTEELLDKGHLK